MNTRPAIIIVLLCISLSGAVLGDEKISTVKVTLPPGVQPPGTHPVATVNGNVLQIDFVPDTAAVTNSPAATASDEPAPSAAKTEASVSSPPDPLADVAKPVNFDRAIDVVPAFAALDLSPETVSHPTTPRDFAAALLNGVDHTGTVQHGIAIETAPFRLLPMRTDIDAYRESALARFLYNFSLSAATSKASDKDKAVQVALGFSAILYQSASHDPARDPKLRAQFAEITNKFPMTGGGFNSDLPEENPDAKQALQLAAEDFQKRSWCGSIWSAAIAPTWNSESGKASDLGGSGFTAWSAFAYGVYDPLGTKSTDPINAQFIAQLRYRNDEHVVDQNNNNHTANQDSFIAAGRLRLGTTTFNGFAEGGYVHVWHGLLGDRGGWLGAVGLEKRLASNIWLVLSAGEQFGETSAKTNDLFVISSLRLGTADNQQFAPPK